MKRRYEVKVILPAHFKPEMARAVIRAYKEHDKAKEKAAKKAA